MPVTPTQIVLVAAGAGALAYLWRSGTHAWRSRLEARFLYGVPWGTLVTVALVVIFYLVAQWGARYWSEPLTYPFITWSYFYPTGILTAGVAHGSPAHLLSNMTATLAFAPIAEYVWSHYRPGVRDDDGGGVLAHPWVRAVVIFPAALLLAAFLTGLFSLGPGLGFSGAVFAIAGFALVNYPLATIVAVVASSALGTVIEALSQPILREAISPGAPGPPAWASIGFQAHLLGFLLGVVAAVLLLRRRGRQPALERVFAATLLFGMIQALWLLVWPDGSEAYVLYQGAGVVLVFGLAVLVAAAATGSERPLVGPITYRQTAVGGLVCLLVFVALVGVPFGFYGVTGDADAAVDGVEAGDYTVGYEKNATIDSAVGNWSVGESNHSGVLVVSPERDFVTVGVRDYVLAHEGNDTVVVGGVGWRTAVDVERTGWDVLGNDTAYVVDLEVDGETTRSFASEPVRAHAELEGYTVEIVPTDDEFQLRLLEDGTAVDETPVPATNETATVGGMTVSTVLEEGTERIVLDGAETRVEVEIAEREQYPPEEY